MTVAVVKVIFDTNILVSGHFWKGSPYSFSRIPSSPNCARSSPTSSLYPTLRSTRSSIDLARTPSAFLCKDDQAGFSRILTTTSSSMRHCQPERRSSSGDRHLLALGTVDGIEIVTARQFLDRLAAVSSEIPRDPG